MSFTIRNMLEVIGLGKIQVPNCEASSEVSSSTFEVNRAKYCKNTMVDLSDVLAAIPGSRVIYLNNTGGTLKKFLVLPSGPPRPYGCSGDCTVNDWYQIIRDIANDEDTPSKSSSCDTFKHMGCDVSKAFRAG
jgi:hypothetical protein